MATVKLKELNLRVVELQREVLQSPEVQSPAMDSKDHWRLAAAVAKIKKLENTVASQHRKLMCQEELRQNQTYQAHYCPSYNERCRKRGYDIEKRCLE